MTETKKKKENEKKMTETSFHWSCIDCDGYNVKIRLINQEI